MQKASSAVSGRPASSWITREQNPGPNDRPLEHAVVSDPEDGVIGGSTEYHANLSAPHSSTEGVTRLELERQLSVSVSVQTERDEELVDMQARLRDMQAKLDELLLSRDQQIGQYERKLEAVCLRLADAEKGLTSLDELVVSHDQQVGQHEKELTDMRAKLEEKESELEAVRLRPTDAGDGWTRSKTRVGKSRTVTAASLIDLNEDRHECDPKEDKQVMEAGLASPQWNEKNRDG
jgi:chromosome segregation ATPase